MMRYIIRWRERERPGKKRQHRGGVGNGKRHGATLGCHPIVTNRIYIMGTAPHKTAGLLMANNAPLDQTLAIDKPASKLATHKPNRWFNLLALVVVITGIIYAGVHLEI